MRIAYLADGKLWFKEPEAPPTAFTSPFGQTLQQQKEETHRRRAWQQKSMMGGLGPPSLMERLMNQEPEPLPVAVGSVCSGGDGLFFALEAGTIGSFLTLDPARGVERRLFHTADFRLEHLAHSSQHKMMACTILRADGSRHIAVLREDGSTPNEVTEGDAIDMAPRWVPGNARTIVFQSAGVARDSQGFIRDRAPFSVEKLNLDSGEMATLAEDKAYDFMAPRLLDDGSLLCIRRPYKTKEKPNFLKFVLSIVMMPFWFVYAIFKWCSFFSWRYTGRELAPDGAPKRETPPSALKAWGEMLTPQTPPRGRHRDLSETDTIDTAWAPKNWQLVRRAPGAGWQTLAEGVLTYEIAPNGTLLYTDGGAIYLREASADENAPFSGKTKTLHRAAAISEIAIY